jgi:hypothetical protein
VGATYSYHLTLMSLLDKVNVVVIMWFVVVVAFVLNIPMVLYFREKPWGQSDLDGRHRILLFISPFLELATYFLMR